MDPREYAHQLMEMKRLGRLHAMVKQLQQEVEELKAKLAARP